MAKTFFLLVCSMGILNAQASVEDILDQVNAYDTWSESVRVELNKLDELLEQGGFDEEKAQTALSDLDKVFFGEKRPATTTVSLTFDSKVLTQSGSKISLDTALKFYTQNVDFLVLSKRVATTKALIYMALANSYRDRVAESVANLKKSLAKSEP